MTVADLVELFVCAEDMNVVIYDCKDARDVYDGPIYEIPSIYEDAEICSIDSLSKPYSITLNVKTYTFASYIEMFDAKVAEDFRRKELESKRL